MFSQICFLQTNLGVFFVLLCWECDLSRGKTHVKACLHQRSLLMGERIKKLENKQKNLKNIVNNCQQVVQSVKDVCNIEYFQ